MPLIKQGQITHDDWHHLDDEAPLDSLDSGPVIVSFARWSTDKQALLKRFEGKLGIRLNGDDPLETLEPDLSHFGTIALEFPVFTDGRCFSFARTLRERFHFDGEIRAVGDFIRDQIYFLSRVGIDTFEFHDAEAALRWRPHRRRAWHHKSTLARRSVRYQQG